MIKCATTAVPALALIISLAFAGPTFAEPRAEGSVNVCAQSGGSLGSSTYGCGGYGGGFDFSNGGPGAGGASNPDGAGVAGQNALGGTTGGGGGGGAGTTGGAGGTASSGGGAGGAGGAHGSITTTTGTAGADGVSVTTGGGGGGGAGGYGLVPVGDYTTAGNITGGAGGRGGNGFGGTYGAAGQGGSGGHGIFLSSGSQLTNATGTITGGIGGDTGTGRFKEGGRGGSAVVGTGLTVNNSGALVGGNGGNGGLGYDQWGSLGGEGILNPGAGALTVQNSGSIQGGNGGDAAGDIGAAGSNKGGLGGDGIYSRYSQVDIVNTGTIAGGNGGKGINAGTLVGKDGGGGIGITAGSGTITNSGVIAGGNAVTAPNAGVTAGSAGDGIYGMTTLTVINDGTISGGLQRDGTTRANAITFSGTNNRLELQSNYAINGNVVVTSPGSTGDVLALGGDDTPSPAFNVSALGGQYQGFDAFVKTGESLWTLTGTPTGTVTPWTIEQGILAVSEDGNLGVQNESLVFKPNSAASSGGTAPTLRFLNNATFNRGMLLESGKGVLDTEDNQVIVSGVIAGGGSLSKNGSGTLILTNQNDYSGGTQVAQGTLQLGNGGETGGINGNVDVSQDAILAFNRLDVVTFTGVISGNGSVSQVGPGTTILTADNPYAGLSKVTRGTLALAPGAALSGTNAVQVSSGATFGGYGITAGSVQSAGTVAVADALAAFAGRGAGTLTIQGDLANSGLVNLVGESSGNTLHMLGDYSANAAQISLATYLNEGGALSNQHTDRVLIEGNVTGNTTVNITASGTGAITVMDRPSSTTGISIIQVAGNSTMDAFQLEGGSVNLGTPYEYGLYAFGPDSTYGSASADQSLVGNKDSNWDYRLESIYVTPEGPVEPGDPESPEERPEVVPSVPGYISLPTALFNAGFWDLDTLHRRLGEIRYDPIEPASEKEVFIRVYGGDQVYKTNRSFVDYGFGFDQNYAAVQLGGNRLVHTDDEGTWRLGLAAALGRMSLYPDAIDGYSRNVVNKQTGMLTATYLSREGWYVDGILMAGLFDGHVSTNEAPGRTSLRGTVLGGSIESGYPFDLGKGVFFEPQLQFVYQKLHFNEKVDASGMRVDLGSPDAWTMRAGARLGKTYTNSDGSVTTPYLKVNFIHGFDDENTVSIGDVPFRTGRLGEYVQFGAGITGDMKKDVSFYADGAWQTPVGNNGFRGWALNMGVRMRF